MEPASSTARDLARAAAPHDLFFLLWSAPQELVTEVYRFLLTAGPQGDRDMESLCAAYLRIVDRPPNSLPEVPVNGSNGNGRARVRYPWDVLHVLPGAPPAIVDIAYRWHRHQPMPGNGVAPSLGQTAGERPEGPRSDRAAATPGPAAPAPSTGLVAWAKGALQRSGARGRGDGEETKRWAELARRAQPDASGAEHRRFEDAPGAGEQAFLAGEDGTSLRKIALRSRPLTIGSDVTCDISLPVANGFAPGPAVRIWPRRDGFMVHALAEAGVELNGRAVTWAWLEDGDLLRIGSAQFRFAAGAGDASGDGEPGRTQV